MTIQSQTTRVDYTGNGATTNFPVPFYWLQDSDLLVIRTDSAYTPPTVATLALTTDYVVTGSGNQSGGSITTTVAPTATQKLSILRNVPFTQLTHYVPNDPFPAASHEQALDKLTMETQQLNEGLSRSITLPPNATGLSTNLPLPAPNNLIGWNPAANALQNVDPTTLATSVTYGNAVGDKFSGDGTTVNFNLSANPGGINNLDVSIGGVTQRPGIDYTWNAGTTLTFTAAPPAGTNNVLVRYTQALPIGALGVGQVTATNLAAGSVGAAALAAGAVGNAALAANAVKDANVDPAAAIQPTKIAYQAPGSGTVLRDVNGVLQQGVSLFDFIPLNLQSQILNGTISLATDLSPYLAAAQAWFAAKSYKPSLLVPPGVYTYATSPNWAMEGLTVQPLGDVRLRYTGTNYAVILDGGGGSFGTGGIENFRFGSQFNRFTIEANKNTSAAVFARALLTGTQVGANVRGAGNTGTGLQVNWCVMTEFNVEVGPYRTGGWYNDGTGSATPQFGAVLTQRNAGEQTSYCRFPNAAFIGCQYGAYLDYTLGNTFFGGDCEYNTNTGMVHTANAYLNRVYGMNFEVNTVTDVALGGRYSEFYGCDTGTSTNGFVFVSGATLNSLTGGNHQNITVNSGATYNLVANAKYNRGLSTGAFVDAGTGTRISNVVSALTGAWANSTMATGAISVGASPFTYTNNSGRERTVFVAGGTVSGISYFRGATNLGGIGTVGAFRVSPGDSLVVSYSAAPTMNYAEI